MKLSKKKILPSYHVWIIRVPKQWFIVFCRCYLCISKSPTLFKSHLWYLNFLSKEKKKETRNIGSRKVDRGGRNGNWKNGKIWRLPFLHGLASQNLAADSVIGRNCAKTNFLFPFFFFFSLRNCEHPYVSHICDEFKFSGVNECNISFDETYRTCRDRDNRFLLWFHHWCGQQEKKRRHDTMCVRWAVFLGFWINASPVISGDVSFVLFFFPEKTYFIEYL